ncbi:MAG TPA: D-alanyl-D-alanine carboxypeptidase/D-alanyl-D-alanine-endopeptidase [Gemmataceae bacterium]|nr:D-alanyl-D-alanine carboxypeptidase/D-alanyl-D-alanine-endopeptidase [Gemmataceae bacterium]
MRLGRQFRVTLAVLLASAPALWAQTPSTLAGKIEAVMRRPEYKHARWGILIVDTISGATVYAHQAEQLFVPASTTKLYSCAAALMALGPKHRFETPVHRHGEVRDGRLTGDLILVAQGDPTLGGRTNAKGLMEFKDNDHIYANGSPNGEITETNPLAGLNALAKQIADAGVKQVAGEVLIDDRLFEHARSSGSGPDVVSPIMVNDNCVDVVVHPAAVAGQPATVEMCPQTAYYQMDADVTTVAAGKPISIDVVGTGLHAFKVRGQMPIRPKPLVRYFPVEDPARFARALLIEALHANGVRVSASIFEDPRVTLPSREEIAKLPTIATFVSPPFSELMKVTLKVSHNLYASTLPMLVAAHNGNKTLAQGLRAQGRLLKECGVDTSAISFGGGAGGANADAVTPTATVQLLRSFRNRPEYPAFYAGLPILGVDGTLADVAPANSKAKGQVRAKTGTLMWRDVMNNRDLLCSKALGGYLTTAKGRDLTIAFYINGVPLPSGVTAIREGKMLGELCEVVYLNAP